MENGGEGLEARMRRRRMLQTGLVILMMLMLLDSNPPPHGHLRVKPAQEVALPEGKSIEDPELVRLLNDFYSAQEGDDRDVILYAHNATGNYRGEWSLDPERGLGDAARDKGFRLSRAKGRALLQIHMEDIPEVRAVSAIYGYLRLLDGVMSSPRDITLAMQGVFFHDTGAVRLRAVAKPTSYLWILLPPGSNGTAAAEAEAEAAGRRLLADPGRRSLSEVPRVGALAGAPAAGAAGAGAPGGGAGAEEGLKIAIPTGATGDLLEGIRGGVECRVVFDGTVAPSMPLRSTDETGERAMRSAFVTEVTGQVSSEPCDVALNVTAKALRVDWKRTTAKATNYSVVVTIMCVLQIAALLKQLQHSSTQAAAARVSLICVSMQALMDALLCILHLLLCVVIQSLFAAFASIAFFKLVIFCIFEMRYMVVIFQSRQDQSFFNSGWAEIRRHLAALHARFYGVLLGLIVFIYVVNVVAPQASSLMVLAAHSFWVPQIISNVKRDAATPLARPYLFTMSATRLLIPLYLYGCPQNILGTFESSSKSAPTNSAFCITLVLWVGMQTGVLLLQEIYGPQFFVPAAFLPEKYNYRRPIPIEKNGENGDVTCVICMCELGGLDNVMVAPCDHAFHSECLLRWMEERAECPVCRASLPPP